MNATTVAPDDLIPGRTYRFDYISVGGYKVCVMGVYMRMEIDDVAAWFWFNTDCGSVPWDYAALNNMREVSTEEV